MKNKDKINYRNSSSSQYDFIYENSFVELCFIFITWFLSATLFGTLLNLSDWRWRSLLLAPILALPWILLRIFPQIYTYKGVGTISEEGVEVRLKFRTHTLQWKDITNVSFNPEKSSYKHRGLHIGNKSLIKYTHIKLSVKDSEQSLYLFYQTIKEYFDKYAYQQAIERHKNVTQS